MTARFSSWHEFAADTFPATLTAEQVVAVRHLMKWTTQDMADVLGISRQCIGVWERKGAGALQTKAIRFAVIYADLFEPKEKAA